MTRAFAIWIGDIMEDPYIIASADSLEKLAEAIKGKLIEKKSIKPDPEIKRGTKLETGVIRLNRNLFHDLPKGVSGFVGCKRKDQKVLELGPLYIYLVEDDKYVDLACQEFPLVQL